MAISNWLRSALFSRRQLSPFRFTDHWPLATIASHSPCQSKHTPRAAFPHVRRASRFSHRIAKEHPQHPVILSVRQDGPNLESVSGTWSFLNGMSATATGSSRRNRPPSIRLITAFSPGLPCVCCSPRSIVTWTPPAAPPCVRASCWPRGGWIAACSRQGFSIPSSGSSTFGSGSSRQLAGGTGRQRRGIQRGGGLGGGAMALSDRGSPEARFAA